MYTLSSANERHFSTLRMVESPRHLGRLAWFLLFVIVATTCGLAFLPWQQSTNGSGRIVAYNPTERPQTIESPIYGRVVGWGEGIVEGARVKKGQKILEIRDIDARLGDRLSIQVLAVQEKLERAQSKAEAYGRQIVDLTVARDQAIESARQLVEEAERKVDAEKHGVEAAEAAVSQTRSNYERQKRLYEKGLTSGVSFEKDERSYEEAKAKRDAAEEYVEAAENYLKSKAAELEQKSREAQTKVDYARASQQEALGDVALAKKELSEIEGKRAQFESRVVVAPKDGIILRLMVNDDAEMLKEGDPLFTIVPETADRAVELWVDGNDIPLVTKGREVRLQFEGWPAIQFASGWPRLAFGTFGGEVVAVDATDDGKGKFRVLVRPNDEGVWPEDRLLRQGARANGWVLLNEVKLGYELWRQMNGFPPVYGDSKSEKKKSGGYADYVGSDDAKDEGKGSKKVKLPK